MKNKDKYKLTNLEFKCETLNKQDYMLYHKRWKVYVYENGMRVDVKSIDGGSISDIMAWLESEE